MRVEDINYLKENIRCLPIWENKKNNNLKPLANLFIVASQAHTVSNGNKRELKNILLRGSETFSRVISNDYWKKRSEISGYNYSINDLSTRFFTYTIDIPELCQDLKKELKETIESFPKVRKSEIENFISDYVVSKENILKIDIKNYQQMLENKNKYEELLKEIEKNKLERIKKNSDNREVLKEKIKKLALDSLDEFSDYYYCVLNTDSIIIKIKEKKIKKKIEDVEFFVSQYQDEIHQKCLFILEKKMTEFIENTKKYIKQYKENINISFEKFNIENIFENDYRYKMLFGIGVGLDIVISLGFALTGGVIVAGILGMISFFSGSWEKDTAKKIVKAYEDNNCILKYKKVIENYWKNVEIVVDNEMDKIDRDWNNYIEVLKINIENFNKSNINNNINTLKNIQKIFEKIKKEVL